MATRKAKITDKSQLPPYFRELQCDPQDLDWIARQVSGFAANVAAPMLAQYSKRYTAEPKPRKGARRNAAQFSSPRRNANMYLREQIESLKPILSALLIPAVILKREHATEQFIRAKHKHIYQQYLDILELRTIARCPQYRHKLARVYLELRAFMLQLNVNYAIPLLKVSALDIFSTDEAVLESAIARMTSEHHITKRALAYRARSLEHIAIAAGLVKRGAQPYISENSYKDWRNKKRANQAWLAAMVAENTLTGEQINLEELVSQTSTDPEKRRIELMVRLRGFEELAEELGYVASFITWTAPSKYHKASKKWNGSDPRDTQAYLVKQWAKARAALGRETKTHPPIEWFGFRVAEPHHDATPHWHMLIFVNPEHKAQALSILKSYALQHDASEKGAQEHRFTVEDIDPARGSATGYIAKYISKNINAAHMDGDKDDETELDSSSSASRVSAWASWHRIRQFQQFGGCAVTLWRELRRIKSPSADPLIEPARLAADSSRWADFCKTAKDLSIVYEDTGVNEYNEPTKRPRGVTGSAVTEVTRLVQWVITQAKNKALALSGGDSRPWSTVSNCTQDLVKQVNDHLNRCFGIDDSHITAALFSGARVRVSPNQVVRLRGNQLIEMRR